MAINADAETLVSIPEAAKACDRDKSTLFSWCSLGLAGVTLETVFVGGCRKTSLEAIERFYESVKARMPKRSLMSAG